uniref:Papilin a, proteoglycan-like sulfated glycoprotein n=1 Tax=Mastacembelus armatus TaxID=205130 RepID=A0A3Q3KSC0_9TELE
ISTYRTDGGHNCVGLEKTYEFCNLQDCPQGSKDFREVQCSQFDGMDFQGKRYKWIPYYGAANPCELNCMPRGENFYYRHRSAVVDGTPCHPGRRDVCLAGICKRLGCDNVLKSSQQEDPCLQCGGNGDSCYRVKNTFSVRDLPNGYNQMFIIPAGATTISIREKVATRNYLAVKNLRGEYYLNGNWAIEFSRATPIASTVLFYQRGAEGENIPETIVGRGPTTEPIVVELISQEPNQGVEYEFYLPNGQSRQGYYWSFGSWSTCSKECESGYQSRLVFCTIDNEAHPDYLCASLARPPTNQTCNPHPCPQTRSWRTGEWSTCSVRCGGGSQVRSVQCVSHDASGPRVVEDAVCAAYTEAPPSLQTCNMHLCAEYHVTSWSACSVTCGSGEQTREVTCVSSDGVRLEEMSCRTLLRPSAVQLCEMAACPNQISWHVGEWGLCSRSCGSGSRERQVVCSDRERNLYPVDQCNAHPKPPTMENCNTQSCYNPQREYLQTDLCVKCLSPSVHRPEADPTRTNTVHSPHSSAPALHCTQSYYGCCPDGRTSARGPQGLGCPQAPPSTPVQSSCVQTRYPLCDHFNQGLFCTTRDHSDYSWVARLRLRFLRNTELALSFFGKGCEHKLFYYLYLLPSVLCLRFGCCQDGVTAAQGPNKEGCVEYPLWFCALVERSTCSLPHAAGSCSSWVSRYHYDVIASKCAHFWYGGCYGNSNNFMTRAECERACQVPSSRQQRPVAPAGEPDVRRESVPGSFCLFSFLSSLFWPGCGRSLRLLWWLLIKVPTAKHKVILPHAFFFYLLLFLLPLFPPFLPSFCPCIPSCFLSLTLGEVTIDKTDPSTVEALVGQTIVLPCRVSPPPSSTVTVEWRRDGVPLSAHRSVKTNTFNASLSMLTTVIILQSFVYIFQASPAAQWFPAHWSCHPVRLWVVFVSSLLEMRAGQTAKLPCTIVPPSALQSVSIQWTKDGQTLSNARFTQHSDGSLIISPLKSEDSGFYTCTASSQQQLEQRQLQLRVQADLRITTAPNNIQVSEGSTALLPCVVSGDNVSIGWSRNGVPVRPDGRNILISSEGSLILNSVKPSQEGTYTCNAYTGIYSVSATAEVRVIKEPQQGVDVSPECVDQPELANCELIVYARLCSNSYYSSFCCASCTRHSQSNDRFVRPG